MYQINLKKTILFLFLIFLLNLSYATDQSKQPKYITISPPVQKFIQHMAKKHHFQKNQLLNWFQHTEIIPRVIQSMNKPFEKVQWHAYQQYFVCDKYIKPGVIYWKKHHAILSKIQKQYGVDPTIILAIIGIESFYGKYQGSYQEIGALSTLAFDYPSRAKFFKKELEEYLLLTKQQHLSVLKTTGSYAGALGIPQFMPSSYRHYGVDMNHNHHIDLLHDDADAIASIANYLKKAGWRPGPVAVLAKTPKQVTKRLLSSNAKPRYSLRYYEIKGIKPKSKILGNRKAALIKLTSKDFDEYWLTFRNFKAIMRYNPSTNYAMAVFQLSRAIKDAYEQAN